MTIDMQMIFENRIRHNCLHVINYYNGSLYENLFLSIYNSFIEGIFNLSYQHLYRRYLLIFYVMTL